MIGNLKNSQKAQRRAAMDRRMHCIIPNESYNINHNNIYHNILLLWLMIIIKL